MTPAEQHLAIELAVWNADQVRRFGTFKPSPIGPLLDSADSPFAGACYSLWDLGCAFTYEGDGSPRRGDHGAPPAHFRIADEREIRQALAEREIMPKQFSSLIHHFIMLRDVTPEAFALTGESFRPVLPETLLDAFAAAQFINCFADGCRWTDLMAQWVEWAAPDRHWESDEQSRDRRLRNYGPIWESMPPGLKVQIYNGATIDRLKLPDAIRRFWDGERWRTEQLPNWDDQKRLIDAMIVADNIQRLMDEGQLRLRRLATYYKWARSL